MKLIMEEVIANSFKDYHVKGFDYLCLGRTPQMTTKLYLFEGTVPAAAEVVNPHDHRYNFRTDCLAGAVRNHVFIPVNKGDPWAEEYNAFEYRTPLNGGNGFEPWGSHYLARKSLDTYNRNQFYLMKAEQFHTIEIAGSETALLLYQYEDVVPIGSPTITLTKSDKAPSLSGLYSRFTADEVLDRLRKLERIGGPKIICE